MKICEMHLKDLKRSRNSMKLSSLPCVMEAVRRQLILPCSPLKPNSPPPLGPPPYPMDDGATAPSDIILWCPGDLSPTMGDPMAEPFPPGMKGHKMINWTELG